MNVLIADDNILFREGLSLLVYSLIDRVVLDLAANWEVLHADCFKKTYDLVIINRNLPGSLSWQYEIKKTILDQNHKYAVLRLDEVNSMNEQSALRLGFDRCITKDTSLKDFELIISGVARGKSYLSKKNRSNSLIVDSLPRLTARQLEVLLWLKDGASNKEIGLYLGLCEGTVKQHLNKIYKILLVHNRVEAIRMAIQLGLI